MYFVINITLADLNRSQSLTSDGDLILNTAQICASSFFAAVLTVTVGGGRDKRKIIMFVAYNPNQSTTGEKVSLHSTTGNFSSIHPF